MALTFAQTTATVGNVAMAAMVAMAMARVAMAMATGAARNSLAATKVS